MDDKERFKRYEYLYNEANFYIPIDKLETGGLYWILARNAHVGIWFSKEKGFVIPREKFGRTFPFVEYHWDINKEFPLEPFDFGTVKPFELIEIAPFKIEDFFHYKDSYGCFGWALKDNSDMRNELLKYLLMKSVEYNSEGLYAKYANIPS
ncbi:MAG: hypothetical protein HQK76_20695 [Desulfobacterales bacterium]|nr:hypothetical protein [Desulfobacterales bacterium]